MIKTVLLKKDEIVTELSATASFCFLYLTEFDTLLESVLGTYNSSVTSYQASKFEFGVYMFLGTPTYKILKVKNIERCGQYC